VSVACSNITKGDKCRLAKPRNQGTGCGQEYCCYECPETDQCKHILKCSFLGPDNVLERIIDHANGQIKNIKHDWPRVPKLSNDSDVEDLSPSEAYEVGRYEAYSEMLLQIVIAQTVLEGKKKKGET